MDGNYTRLAIKGRNGESLRDHWVAKGGPTTYLGLFVPGFPNLLMMTGPNSPFTNLPPTIETQVEFLADTVARAEGKNKDSSNGVVTNGNSAQGPVIEALAESEDQWTQLCKDLCDGSLFKRTSSWIFGANIPGKPQTVMFYFGGLAAYRKVLKQVVESGYEGFKPF